MLQAEGEIHVHSWFLYDPSKRNHLEQSFQQYSDSLSNLTLRQFYQIYENTIPVFMADSKDPFTFYNIREDSLHFVDELLMHQFNND